MKNQNKILSIKNLQVKFRVRSRILTAIRNVSFDLYDGEILALVGESGSGKSVITKTFTGMLESNGWISEGSIIYKPNEVAIEDIKTHFIKPVDLVNIQNSVIDKSIINFVEKTNNIQIKSFKKQVDQILSLNPIEPKNFDTKKVEYEVDEEIKKLNEEISKYKIKAQEFSKRKNAEKLTILEKKLVDLIQNKEIIHNTKLRDEKLSILQKEITKYEIDTKKLKPLSQNDVILMKKIISVIENHIDSGYLISDEQNLEIESTFENKIYISRFEKEIKTLFDDIFNNKKLTSEQEKHFLNIMIDWDHINGNYFTKKNKANKALREVRGKTIATIFQDPMTSLNPLLTVGFQISEVLRKQLKMSRSEAKKETIKLLNQVGIPDAENRYKDIPGQYSGGMRQRVVIAIALACRPKILICDEPTTALDVTIQAQILRLIRELQKEYHFSVIFITHDLGVVANIADRVAVMYAGQIVEIGTTHEIFNESKHPYTWALLLSLPQLGVKGENLYSIAGTPPSLFSEIKGDAFAPRNKFALAIDYIHEPPMFKVSETHYAKTWLLHPKADKNIRPTSSNLNGSKESNVRKRGKKNA